MTKKRYAALALAVVVPLALAGCSTDAPAPADDTEAVPDAPAEAVEETTEPEPVAVPTLQDDGIDVCMRLAAEHLGADIKLLNLTTSFSGGEVLDERTIEIDDPPEAGDLTTCSLQYQDPADENKVIEQTYDAETEAFGDPIPVQLSVSGNSGDFVLDDYVIPIGDVNAAAVADTIAQFSGTLDEQFSQWAWTSLYLEQPGAVDDGYTLRVFGDGQHRSNDMIGSMGITLAPNGADVVREFYTN